jgi:hypothetical protein
VTVKGDQGGWTDVLRHEETKWMKYVYGDGIFKGSNHEIIPP